MPITPNRRVALAIEKARTNDPKGVVSVKDAKSIANTAAKELQTARDKKAEAHAIGAALATLPPHAGTMRAAHVLNVVAARIANVSAMPAFTADGKPAGFEEISAAAAALLRDVVGKRRNSGKDIPWSGPENTRAIAAGSPPFAEQLSKEGLAYHRERGRDALTMIATVLVQLGSVQGTRLAGGSHQPALVDGLKARASGASEPSNAALEALLKKIEAGDMGPAAAPVAGAVTGVLEPKGAPFLEAELTAPVRAALAFAFETRNGAKLEQALTSAFAIGVEQGKRIARDDNPRGTMLSIGVDALKRGDVGLLKQIVSLL